MKERAGAPRRPWLRAGLARRPLGLPSRHPQAWGSGPPGDARIIPYSPARWRQRAARPAWGCGGSAAWRGAGRPGAPRAGCVPPRAARSARLAAAGSTLSRQDPLAGTLTIRTAGHTLSGETRPASRPAPPPLPAIEAPRCRGWGSQRPPLGAGSCSGERGAGGSLGQGGTRPLH